MKGDRKLEVAAWRGAQPQTIQNARLDRSSRSPGVLGLLGTIILHTLVLQSALLESQTREVNRPEVQGPGATLIKSGAEPAGTLILIELPMIVKAHREILEELASAGVAHADKLITTISPDPLPDLHISNLAIDEEKDSAITTDSGDSTERARLYGIYSGQIHARIERIWKRPRTRVSDEIEPTNVGSTDETFQCQVQIVQDFAGNVQEVLLPNCNGSVAWQHSLVLAVNQSSPLPAPPHPTVFSRTITLNFVGYAYIVGHSSDDYESAPIKTTQAASPKPQQINPDFLPSVPVVHPFP